jgi:hypothetical protein
VKCERLKTLLNSLSCGEKVIELEVIEFVIKIVFQRIFDFHLKFDVKQITLSLIAASALPPPPSSSHRALIYPSQMMFTQSFETFRRKIVNLISLLLVPR